MRQLRGGGEASRRGEHPGVVDGVYIAPCRQRVIQMSFARLSIWENRFTLVTSISNSLFIHTCTQQEYSRRQHCQRGTLARTRRKPCYRHRARRRRIEPVLERPRRGPSASGCRSTWNRAWARQSGEKRESRLRMPENCGTFVRLCRHSVREATLCVTQRHTARHTRHPDGQRTRGDTTQL